RFLQTTVHEDYDFLLRKVDAATFDREVEALYEAIPDLADHEVIVGLARIVALFQYGHTGIYTGGWYADEATGFHQLPYQLYYFSDGLYVQGVHQDYAEALGAKVIAIEGMPIDEVLAAVRPVVSAENDQFFKAHGMTALGTLEVLHAQGVTETLQTSATLTLEKGGRTFDVTFSPVATEHYPGNYGLIQEDGEWLDARDNGTDPLWLSQLDKIYFYEYLPDSRTVYIRHSQIQDDPTINIPDFYAEVFKFIEEHEVDRLVLDVRLNGGGNNYKNKPIVTGVIRCEKINQPGKFIVIIGRRTFSACQNLVNELDNYTEAVFFGEPTSENINFYGDVNRPVLPNSQLTVRLSYAWWQDKPQWENAPWLAPQVAVDLSFEDYQTNHDPVLEAALAYNDFRPFVDPIDSLSTLFMSGRVDEIEPTAKAMLADSRYRYYPFEERLNSAAYRIMNQGMKQEAVFVFELVTTLFPDSPNAWDSLAEGYWQAGNLDKAREYYQKAIDMDPDGPTGENARRMLAEMDKE
ncbi:MAG: tetratricopeptide repeat protein, partial [Lewinella sp.]|nr:tetratricopeptide repeat protein [Lewinella sp.]